VEFYETDRTEPSLSGLCQPWPLCF